METYADVIDAYELSEEKKRGMSLTDYIKRHNIKIQYPEEKATGGIMRKNYALGDEVEEIEEDVDVIEFMKDQGIPMGEQVRSDNQGIMNQASGIRPEIRIEEVVKEFIRKRGRRPKSFEEIVDFYRLEMGTADASQVSGSKYSPEIMDEYESYKIQQIDVDPSKLMNIDDWYMSEYGAARAGVQSGGLAGILGV
tara:strand:- start:28 stop:612 length:585 start_codon:yes stop_codon:yes gene_type:complete